MQTSVTFKNIDPSDNLRSYVSDKLDRFDRLLDNPAEANVVLSVEKFRHIAEINITGDRLRIKGKEETNDMYSAIDMVLDKLEIQIKKSKQKVRERRTRGGSGPKGGIGAPSTSSDMPAQEEDADIFIRTVEYKPMDAEEAVMQLDLAEENFLVFTNARTDQINVVYRRTDGNYGLVQPRQ